MSKTIRLISPDWQGGNKREYYFGAELLSWFQKEIKLAIETPKNEGLVKENGVIAQSIVKQNIKMAAKVLKYNFFIFKVIMSKNELKILVKCNIILLMQK